MLDVRAQVAVTEFLFMYAIATAALILGIVVHRKSTKVPGLVGKGFLLVAVLSGLYSGANLANDLFKSKPSDLATGVYAIVFLLCALAYALLTLLAWAMAKRPTG